ncbi:MAG: zf-HC2 domain-containing protein, partial [Candidatus Krumholzibacteriota bacterium]|nr:zf-HC2 domain-containing protein [Candidatus Krumholzibacteriota bacterium]
MNCAEIERLLPLYIEGDLPSGQEELVRAHLDDCAECRRSHQWFLSLESSLRGIKRELPAPDKVADGVCLRLGIAP